MTLLELAPPTPPTLEEHPGILLLPSLEPAAEEEILIYRDDHTDVERLQIDVGAVAAYHTRARVPPNSRVTIVRETTRKAETGSRAADSNSAAGTTASPSTATPIPTPSTGAEPAGPTSPSRSCQPPSVSAASLKRSSKGAGRRLPSTPTRVHGFPAPCGVGDEE